MYLPIPLHDYAIVMPLPDVMQRIASSNPDTPLPKPGEAPTGRIILPDSMASDGLAADSGTSAKRGEAVTRLLVGRVLYVGPGKHREGLFIPPTIKARDLVLFMPRTVSYEFAIHGRNIKIVPYHELVGTMLEVAATSPEWLEFLALVAGEPSNETKALLAEAV
jgi:hypothetical protein